MIFLKKIGFLLMSACGLHRNCQPRKISESREMPPHSELKPAKWPVVTGNLVPDYCGNKPTELQGEKKVNFQCVEGKFNAV